ncbi:hypothetical protein B0J13DRAFT_610810 [Dactylonectria estremocensis]|uniref:Uncharacterized protein n=1 Tax=Dactylonectria estremocensis TaxID=1079267 RepID=A0A9P9IUX4_9HYPO|nr:hypothetical protein B0J13DRAFT_610810 [Dactylonectria estremocensis]
MIPAQTGRPSAPKDKEDKGLDKILSRTETMLKRDESSKQMSGVPTSLTLVTDIRSQAKLDAPTNTAISKKNEYDDLEGVIKVGRKDLFEERARKLGEKYGLEIKQRYSNESTALRVEKPIGMRVHRTCAACSATFSSAKECPSCGSTKYKRCMPKRTETGKIASRKRRAARLKANKKNAFFIPDYGVDFKETVLKRPSTTIFPGGVADGTVCKKCADWARLKPRKDDLEPDADVLKSVPAKIEALKLG